MEASRRLQPQANASVGRTHAQRERCLMRRFPKVQMVLLQRPEPALAPLELDIQSPEGEDSSFGSLHTSQVAIPELVCCI